MLEGANSGKSINRFHELQNKLEKALKKGSLSDDDPIIKQLFTALFKENKEATLSWIASHDGKISALVSKLDQLGLTEKKIQGFCDNVLNLQKSQDVEKQEPVTMKFLFDLDEAPDFNEVMLSWFNNAVEYQTPVITTHSIFRATKSNPKKARDEQTRRDKNLKGIEKLYDIYSSGGYLVFVPKNLGKVPKERAQKLDLNRKSLKKVTLEEAWLIDDQKASIEGLKNLFTNQPKQKKYISVGGHGETGSPAGLNSEHYREFLNWIETQNCQGLLLNSCHSGGESSMLHLAEKATPKFLDQPSGVSYPVLVRSIGDFPSIGGGKVEADIHSFFQRVNTLFDTPGGNTIYQLRKALMEEEKGGFKKPPANLVQVYFPHSSDSPGGFRPVGEGGNSYPLTYARYQKQQLETYEGIQVSNKRFLEVSPAVVESPVEIIGEDTIILSIIPGQARHLFKEIQLGDINTVNFLKSNAQFYTDNKVGVTKIFFISKLKSESEEFHQVFIDVKSGQCGFRSADSFYLMNLEEDKIPKEVSPIQYLLQWKNAIERSIPDERALRAATGGHQSGRELIENLEQETFWVNQIELYQNLRKLLTPESLEACTKLIESLKMRESDITSWLNFILPRNEKLACELFKKLKLSPDSKDEEGVPLLVHATNNQSTQFAKVLIEKGADIHILDPSTNKTPFVLALMDDGEMLDLFLEQKSADLKAEFNKVPTYLYAVMNKDSLIKCLKKDPSLDLNYVVQANKKTLLDFAIDWNHPDVVELLLEKGVDPDGKKGKLSPLAEAIKKGDMTTVDALLKYGADPYVKEEAIVEAMLRCSFDFVKKLIGEKIFDIDAAKSQNIFLAALDSGEEKKIRLALQFKPTLSKDMSYQQFESLGRGMDRLHFLGREDLINELIVPLGEDNPDIGKFIVGWFGREMPEALVELMTSYWKFPEILDWIIPIDEIPQDTLQKIIQKGVELGIDLNTPPRSSYIRTALGFVKPELARYLIEQGVDPKPASEAILMSEDPKLIKIALEKGLGDSAIYQLLEFTWLTQEEIASILTLIVEYGGDLNAPSTDLYVTPFAAVARYGSVELVKWCLKQGAIISPENPDMKVIPIQAATANKTDDAVEVIKLLVSEGGDINQKGRGSRPLILGAIAKNDLELVRLCFEHGAKIEGEEHIKQAFSLAEQLNNAEMIEELKERGLKT